jgi:MFS family permease
VITARATGSQALSKPLFALATGPMLVFVARFLDRIGKGIRGAPRDALIADLTPKDQRGAAFGLRQSLDTVGAFAGPLLAMALMLAWHDDFRAGLLGGGDSPRSSRSASSCSRSASPRAVGDAKAEKVRFERATLKKLGPRILGRHRRRHGAHPGAFQRSLPHPARAGPGARRWRWRRSCWWA